jgi:hypothetical protein
VTAVSNPVAWRGTPTHLDLHARLLQGLWVAALEQLHHHIRPALGFDHLPAPGVVPHPVLLVQALGRGAGLVGVVAAQLAAGRGACGVPAGNGSARQSACNHVSVRNA